MRWQKPAGLSCARQSTAIVCGFGVRFASRTKALPHYSLRRCATLTSNRGGSTCSLSGNWSLKANLPLVFRMKYFGRFAPGPFQLINRTQPPPWVGGVRARVGPPIDQLSPTAPKKGDHPEAPHCHAPPPLRILSPGAASFSRPCASVITTARRDASKSRHLLSALGWSRRWGTYPHPLISQVKDSNAIAQTS